MSAPLGGPSADPASAAPATPATTGPATPAPGTSEYEQLPDDHPLVKRLEAQKAEIKDLKPKASRLREIEDAAKTKEEKDAETLAAAKRDVEGIPAKVAEALKTHLVALHKIDAEDADLFLTATEPDKLLKQIDRLVGQGGNKRSKRNNPVPREGENPTGTPANGDMRDFVRGVFGAGTD